MIHKCCRGDGEGRKDNDMMEDREAKQLVCEELCVCDKVVCETWSVTKKNGVCVCVTKLSVKDGV